MTIDESRKLSSFVPDRLPEFVRVEHPTLVAFLSAYYEWLGLERNSGKILSPLALKDITDIDRTLDQFVERFKSQYLFNFPESLAFNKETNLPVDAKQLIKNIKQFYLAKGTEKSYEFLFRIFFDAAVEFYYPKVDILRLSSGRWTQNNYLRVSNSLGNTIYRAAGNNIIQRDSSGQILATAKVVSVDTFQIGNFPVAELLITARNGTFRTGDLGIEFDDGEEKFKEVYVYSVISSVDIVNSGTEYQVGDRVRFLPQDEGQQAEGTVVEVDSVGGVRKINIDDFGINYTNESVEIRIDSARGSGFVGNVNLGSLCQSAGYYANNDGRLSTNKVLPDNQFYQNWSYVLKSEVVIDKYREMIRRLVHPVGTGMFGSVLIKRCAELDLQNASALMSYEVPLIGHYAPYTFNTFDDLSLWFDQGISNYEKADAIYQGLLTQFNSCFGETSGSTDWEGCKQFDYNFDGFINGDDLGLFLTRWGDGPEAPGYSPQLHNIYIQGIGSGYAVSGNPITNLIEFVGATSYNEVLKTEDFTNADPFWIIYTHPNKKVERGYHIAKIWKSQIDDFLRGDNNGPWHEWQYVHEHFSQEQIDQWNSFPMDNQEGRLLENAPISFLGNGETYGTGATGETGATGGTGATGVTGEEECDGCNCGNGGGIGAPIYRDPPTTITGGFPPFDPNENNPCLGVRTPCGLGVMQSNPYDFKYALLEYDENSEFRKITARAFFNMPQGQEFDCRDESFGNVPIPKIVINSPIFGAVVNNPKVPVGVLASDYNYFRTFTVLFDIENSESLPIYRAVEIRAYLNNRPIGTFGLNGRKLSLKNLRDGRHTLKIEIYDKTGKLIPGSQAISIFGYQFVPPKQRPAIFDRVSVETPIVVGGTPFSVAGIIVTNKRGSEIFNTIKELVGNSTINVPVTLASTSTDGPFIARNTPDDPILTGMEYIEIEGSDPTTPVSPPECGCVPFTRDSCCCKSLLLPPDFFRPEIIPYRPAPPFNPNWNFGTVPCGWYEATYSCECTMTIDVTRNCNGKEETKEEFVPLHQEFRFIQPPGWDTFGWDNEPFQVCPDWWVRENGNKPCSPDIKVPWWGIPTSTTVSTRISTTTKTCQCRDPSTGCVTDYLYTLTCEETITISHTPGCDMTPGVPIPEISPESPSPLFINASDIR